MNSTTHRLAVVSTLALLTAGGLAGCSSEESQEVAEAAVCDSLSVLKTSVSELAALAPTSTVEETKEALSAVTTAVDDVQTELGDLNTADAIAATAAAEALQKTAEGLSGSATLQEGAAAVRVAAEPMTSIVTEIENGVQCG